MKGKKKEQDIVNYLYARRLTTFNLDEKKTQNERKMSKHTTDKQLKLHQLIHAEQNKTD